MDRLDVRIRRLLVALERLESTWRHEHSLSANEKLVISFLSAEGSLTPKQLSEFVGLTTAGISTLIDRMEAAEHVVRRRHPDDGRRVLVSLTKKAARARLGFESVTTQIAANVQDLDARTIDQFIDVATRTVLQRAGK